MAPTNTDETQITLNRPTKDDKYFFDDGDCTFVVGDVWFKLHKVILSRDPESMFRDMFSIPQCTTGTTPPGAGLEDEPEPIPLSGDSADEFRALCWALYALPPEIQAQNNFEASIKRLWAVATMSHKYSLSSFEAWALGVIWIHSRSKRDYLNTCPQDMLDGIHEAATAGQLRGQVLVMHVSQNRESVQYPASRRWSWV